MDFLAALTAAAVMAVSGFAPTAVGSPAPDFPIGVVLAGAVVVAVVEALFAIAGAAAADASWWEAARAGWASRLVAGACQIGVALAVTALVDVQQRLLLVLPAVLLLAHAARAHRATLVAERRAWERLATLTDALHARDTTDVVYTAVRGAADLFAGRGVEIVEAEWDDLDGRRLVRAAGDLVCFDGSPAQAPTVGWPWSVAHVMAGQSTVQPGQVRLLTRDRRAFADRDARVLGVFCAALGSCVESALAHARLEYEANHDPLTGLANRRLLKAEATELLKRGPLALLFLDLGGFKHVNDTLGHEAGDRVLVAVAERLRHAVAADGHAAARLGGDEFAVLLPNLRGTAAAHRARQIEVALCQPVELDDVQIPIRASAGMAMGTPTMDAAELLRRADIAMYQAKRSAASVTVFDPSDDTADALRLELAAQLPTAIASGQITVLFEPILALATGEAVAARAKPTWEHVAHGVLPADLWWPVATQYHPAALTKLVLYEAAAAVKTWRDHGHPIPVEIAISPSSLRDPRLPVSVLAATTQYGVHPGDLIIDIVQVEPDPVLDKLRAAGVRFVLDRFGTSTASLAILDQMPFAGLRVDRSFVAQLTKRTAAAVVKGAVRLGQDLSIAVCAEGIDTPARRRAALALGCTYGNGELLGAPQTASDLARRIEGGVDGVPGRLITAVATPSTVVAMPRRAS
ncbi:putative bifunctional diguanylate cyclase/phosphodiesterase [Phytohabitans aurantiacus]|uniref:putative bifunctional diguanylate cyclase/phosphodiesterase n=1 Tax=Phytohabitans aurantiacus TaxID=3016789 RepID=UPI002490DAFF|nr:EAL domain-containing protein [Phytohabitans aurantiacus]